MLWRTDDANVPAADLHGRDERRLDAALEPRQRHRGFGSYFFCHFQCGYDMFVESPPGQPDTVWIGGAMNYDELPVFGGTDARTGVP